METLQACIFCEETNKAMNESRETIAKYLGAEPSEIIFTASGSESDNLAIRGIARAYKSRGKTYNSKSNRAPSN